VVEVTTQDGDDAGLAARELTVLVMASTVVRTLCWLPLQIFVLADVFGPEAAETGEPEVAGGGGGAAAYRRKWELFCVCAALTGSCLTLPVMRAASSECRAALRLVLCSRCRRSDRSGTDRSEIDRSENHSNLAVARRLQITDVRYV